MSSRLTSLSANSFPHPSILSTDMVVEGRDEKDKVMEQWRPDKDDYVQ
jgi:hypothetical protein